MRKIALALVSAVALGIATGAPATVTVDAGTTVDVTGPTGNELVWSMGYSQSGTTSPFTETLVFTNTLPGIYGFSLITTASGAGADNDVDITSALITGGSIVGSVSLATFFNNDIHESYGIFDLGLGAGQYTLTIEGTRGTTGSFGGNVAFHWIPEPATWLMMLLGFGAVGYSIRSTRRQLRQIA